MASKFKIPENKEGLIIMSKLCEQCERFDEMLLCMKNFVRLSPELNSEERNLLSVAYKNVIGSRRACWRVISSVEFKEDLRKATAGGSQISTLIRTYKQQIEAELGEICSDVLQLLEKSLIPAANSTEEKVFYLKMKGDYHRYYAEVDVGDEQRNKANEAYAQATELAASLKATNPIRLGLALNYSVFYYEILKSTDKGCQLARSAFEEALNDPNIMDEDQHKEAALIMQLLRENLNLWTEDIEGGGNSNENDNLQVQDAE